MCPFDQDCKLADVLVAAGCKAAHSWLHFFYAACCAGNACGTIGLLHALANNRDKLHIGEQPGQQTAAGAGCLASTAIQFARRWSLAQVGELSTASRASARGFGDSIGHALTLQAA